VTASINTVAAALRLSAPGEILLTDHEYGAMHWCWERAAQRQGVTLRVAELPQNPADPGEVVDAITRAFSDRTRLLFFSHVLSPTGMVLPAKELCEVARRRGILTMIDGAHAPAMIPLDLSSLACDFYGGNCHKWLLAPTGSGFLYFGAGAERLVQPLQVSWGWHNEGQPADDPDEFGSTPLIRSFEFEGTRDPCPWLTVPTALAFQERLGWASIRARISDLTDHLRHRVQAELALALATPVHPLLHGFLTAFRLPNGVNPPELRRRLWEMYRIEAPIIERPNATLIRVSLHFYNTVDEIDRLVVALKYLLALGRMDDE
jgi:isopenicillin-N epimerase